MTVNHPTWGTMCEICFSGLTPNECAVDENGDRWDVCSRAVSAEFTPCAEQAGIKEKVDDD